MLDVWKKWKCNELCWKWCIQRYVRQTIKILGLWFGVNYFSSTYFWQVCILLDCHHSSNIEHRTICNMPFNMPSLIHALCYSIRVSYRVITISAQLSSRCFRIPSAQYVNNKYKRNHSLLAHITYFLFFSALLVSMWTL